MKIGKTFLKVSLITGLIFALSLVSFVFSDEAEDFLGAPSNDADVVYTPFNDFTLQNLTDNEYLAQFHRGECDDSYAINGYTASRHLEHCVRIRP